MIIGNGWFTNLEALDSFSKIQYFWCSIFYIILLRLINQNRSSFCCFSTIKNILVPLCSSKFPAKLICRKNVSFVVLINLCLWFYDNKFLVASWLFFNILTSFVFTCRSKNGLLLIAALKTLVSTSDMRYLSKEFLLGSSSSARC